MSNEEIEKELNERLRFKLQELEDGMKNRVRMNILSAFSLAFSGDHAGSQRVQHYAEAWKEMLSLFEKEKNMGLPSPHMYASKIAKAKNEYVDNLMVYMEEELNIIRGYDSKMRMRLQKRLAYESEKLLETKI
jgi:hypothetical protein